LPEPPGGGEERCLLLDGIQDPGNVGTLIRAAAALGVHRVLVLDGTADPWGPKAIRASAGHSFTIPIHTIAWTEAERWLEGAGLPLFVAERGGIDLRDWLRSADAAGRNGSGWALLLGNEGRGPREQARARATARLGIPLAAGVDSLNVSTAGAILLWTLGMGRPSTADTDRTWG
jgi:TrmH family RNA methyltransferase